MFFSLPYEYPPCGMFTVGHAILLAVTAVLIAAALVRFKNADERLLRRIIRICTAVLFALEIAKILFVLLLTGSRDPNDFIPLYYCSLVLYAGLFSSLGRGKWQRLGDVFLATSGLVGGLCFLVSPNTSLPRYPAFHFISFHSFLLHGTMVFLGLLLLLRGKRLVLSDLKYAAGLVSAMCAAAWIFNTVFGHVTGSTTVNLMFMSCDFPGTPVHLVWVLTGKLFPIAMWLLQAFPPFLLVYALYRVCLVRHSEPKR